MVYGVAEVVEQHHIQKKGINSNQVIKIVPDPEVLPRGCEIKIAKTWQKLNSGVMRIRQKELMKPFLLKGIFQQDTMLMES